ncbi:hypothetical protein LCGC14_2582350 [marine sediment metagenome]|uniref:Uncharacterized protein n=1 Tax=marine sediment metagenome TaxID=412755 RepID=A0A0F9D6U5_9ZZZZ
MITIAIIGFTFAILSVIFAYRIDTKNTGSDIQYSVAITVLSSMIAALCGLYLVSA